MVYRQFYSVKGIRNTQARNINGILQFFPFIIGTNQPNSYLGYRWKIKNNPLLGKSPLKIKMSWVTEEYILLGLCVQYICIIFLKLKKTAKCFCERPKCERP
jgi:hypothetical protein